MESIDENAGFNPQALDFEINNAYFFAKVASLVYEEPEVAEAMVQQIWGFPGFDFIEGKSGKKIDTQGFVMANAEALIIVFRGTEDDKSGDWHTNLDVDLVAQLGGRVHEGFWDALAAVWEQLNTAIDFMQTNQQKIWLCGHSLGGALATLATARLLDTGREIGGLYTYGQPRVGDGIFAQTMDYICKEKYFRIVNHGDIITRTPPESLEFKHAGTFVFLTDEGQLAVNDPTWHNYWREYGSALANFLDLAIGDTEEHRLQYYIRKLDANR
ncbi:MAG: lipase family protein [Microscillaceae bacterium]|jgi:triacylglycerol lipase|nr:lipase family protein [Microscillaceae bacterium]